MATNMDNGPTPSATVATVPPPRGKFNFWRWFWLGTLVVGLGWVWHDFYVPANNVTWAKDFAAAQLQAAQSGKPMILFFTGKWCVPCRIMKRTVWADAQVETVVKAGFTPVMLDVDDPNAAATVSRYGVKGTPVIILADPQGNVIKWVAGGVDKAAFLDFLGKANSAGS